MKKMRKVRREDELVRYFLTYRLKVLREWVGDRAEAVMKAMVVYVVLREEGHEGAAQMAFQKILNLGLTESQVELLLN